MHFTFLFLDWMLAEWNSHLTGEECFCKPLMRFIMSTFARPLLTAGVKTGIRCNTEEKPSPKFTFQKQRAVPAILLSAFQLWEAWKDVNAWLQMVLPQPQHNLWWTYKGQECSTMKCLGGQILFSFQHLKQIPENQENTNTSTRPANKSPGSSALEKPLENVLLGSLSTLPEPLE